MIILAVNIVCCSEQSRFKILNIWATTWQNQQNECAPSEDSDQTGRIQSDKGLRLRSVGS